MRMVVPILLAMIVWLLPQPSAAQDGEVRRITQTTATSDCIGDNTDPVCTLETLLACRARQMERLCKLAGWRKGPHGTHTAEYRIFSVEKFIDRKYPLMPDGQVWDVPLSIEIGVDTRQCSPSFAKCPATDWRRSFYLMEPFKGQWYIFSAGYKPFDE